MPPATRKTAAPRRATKKAVTAAESPRRTAKKATPARAAVDRFPWDADSFPDQAAAEAALVALKAAVVRKVNVLTERHGWCDEAVRAMQEMRLIRPPQPVTMTIEVEVNQAAFRSMGWSTRSDADVRRRLTDDPVAAARYGRIKSTRFADPTPPDAA